MTENKFEKEIKEFKKNYIEMLNIIKELHWTSAKIEEDMKVLVEQLEEERRNELVKWVEEATHERFWDKV